MNERKHTELIKVKSKNKSRIISFTVTQTRPVAMETNVRMPANWASENKAAATGAAEME